MKNTPQPAADSVVCGAMAMMHGHARSSTGSSLVFFCRPEGGALIAAWNAIYYSLYRCSPKSDHHHHLSKVSQAKRLFNRDRDRILAGVAAQCGVAMSIASADQ